MAREEKVSPTDRRMIVMDTETTGTNPDHDRIIEVGCVEVLNGVITRNKLHFYVDPEREVEEGAQAVHGFNRESLIIASEGKKFKDWYRPLAQFIGSSPLVFHNAPFDMSFLDMEYARLGFEEKYLSNKVKVFDTLPYARNLHPGKKNSLDALCKRYGIDNSRRELHGALLDAELLAEVFIKMVTPENDIQLKNSIAESINLSATQPIEKMAVDPRRAARHIVVAPDPEEEKAHAAMYENQGLG